MIKEIIMKSGHTYKNFTNFRGLGFGGMSGYVGFDQIAGEATLPTVVNKNSIVRLVM